MCVVASPCFPLPVIMHACRVLVPGWCSKQGAGDTGDGDSTRYTRVVWQQGCMSPALAAACMCANFTVGSSKAVTLCMYNTCNTKLACRPRLGRGSRGPEQVRHTSKDAYNGHCSHPKWGEERDRLSPWAARQRPAQIDPIKSFPCSSQHGHQPH